MKEFIEKLIGGLEEQIKIEESIAKSETEGHPITHQYASNCLKLFRNQVNQLAEEYNNGWIPYTTGCEMPNEASRVWLSFKTPVASFVKSAWYINGHFEWDNCRRVKETPMAWKQYEVTEPYQPKGE